MTIFKPASFVLAVAVVAAGCTREEPPTQPAMAEGARRDQDGGLDVERDVIARMAFRPIIREVRPMRGELFV